MGENSVPPQENMQNGYVDDEEDHNDEDSDESEMEFEDITSEEFHAINNQLDALNSALDDIEQKNDDIHAQLLQLLQSNREIRRQMQESQNVEANEVQS